MLTIPFSFCIAIQLSELLTFEFIDASYDILPQQCDTGWIINNILHNITDIKLVAIESNECNNNNYNNIPFIKEDSIEDLCLAFYSRQNECLLPGETTNALNTKNPIVKHQNILILVLQT